MQGVILSYHGTVSNPDDVPAFVRNIRHGQPAPDDVVAEVRRRLLHIGGSPLTKITSEQAAALEQRLGIPVRIAARLWHPYAKDVVPELVKLGVTRLLSLPLAPQSVAIYHPGVEAAAAEHGLEVLRAPAWGLEPDLLEAFVEAIEEAAERLPAPRRELAVVLSAHSLPRRVIAAGDGYEREFRAMADAVAEALVARGYDAPSIRVAFQSQGMGSRDAWLGPDLETTFGELAGRYRHLLVAPIGFVTEHVETLYDIDVEARAFAEKLGFERLERMPALDVRPRFIDALEAVARRALGG
jgi:ferrochelatase